VANLESGFARLTWVVASLLTLPALVFGVAVISSGDLVLGCTVLGLAVLAFVMPWGVFLTIRWVARGFSAVVSLPIYNQNTGEVTLAGYEPAGQDFPLGGAHATFPVSRFAEAACRRCGRASSEAVIVGTPDGLLCMKHAGWYAKRILVKHYAIAAVFWLFALIGVATTGYFTWIWWLGQRG
jgi:hypothetical protein